MLKWWKEILVLVLMVEAGFGSFAQSFNLKTIKVQDGLAQSNVNRPFQDSKGRLWLPTGGGLTFYNGIELYTYTQKDGLPGTPIFNITEDQNGVIWGSTAQNGIFKWEKGNIQRYDESDGLISNRVREIFLDSKNQLWVITENGCSIFDGNNFINFNSKNGLQSDDLIEIFVEGNAFVHANGKNTAVFSQSGGKVIANGMGATIYKEPGVQLTAKGMDNLVILCESINFFQD